MCHLPGKTVDIDSSYLWNVTHSLCEMVSMAMPSDCRLLPNEANISSMKYE